MIFWKEVLIILIILIVLITFFKKFFFYKKIFKEHKDFEGEDKRMFNFLHDLAEKTQNDITGYKIYKYIADGVGDVIEASSGIIYLKNDQDLLTPTYQFGEIIPIIPINKEISDIEDSDVAKNKYLNLLRISKINIKESIIGEALIKNKPIYIDSMDIDKALSKSLNICDNEVSFLSAPLSYGNKQIGVLALFKNKNKKFSSHDMDIFIILVEQSSYALGTMILYQEVLDKRKLEKDLMQASEIQNFLLPKSISNIFDYKINSKYEAARILSGDYYDYFYIDESHYGIAIGDVCGKGIAASLIMAICRSVFRTGVINNFDPSNVLYRVNKSIFPDIQEDMFVSLLYLILDKDSDKVVMARAGHEPPLLFCKETKEVKILDSPGLVAGVDDGEVFKRVVKNYEFNMKSGDILILYTDGVVESENIDNYEFGIDRFIKEIHSFDKSRTNKLVDEIYNKIKEFSKGKPQNDDITILSIEKK